MCMHFADKPSSEITKQQPVDARFHFGGSESWRRFLLLEEDVRDGSNTFQRLQMAL